MTNDLAASALSGIVLIASAVICTTVGRYLGLRAVVAAMLFGWHTIIGAYYSYYVLVYGGDAFIYYLRAKFDFVQLSMGTDFIVWITSFPVSLGFSYWPIALLFNAAGAIGLVFFYAALREAAGTSIRLTSARFLLLICALIPSLSFWTSGIGKDSMAFLSVGAFLWASMKLDGRQIVAAAAVLLMLLVRPHIAAVMVIAVGVGTVFVARLRASIRFGVTALTAVAVVFTVPMALVYSGAAQFESIGRFISERQEENLGGGSSIDLAQMNPVLRLFSFLFRPFPHEAEGIDQLAASLENLALLALTGVAIVALRTAGFLRVFRQFSIPLIYGTLCLVMLSQVTANLGLASRQKWMLLPALMLVLVGAWRMRTTGPTRRLSFHLQSSSQF